MNTLGGSSFLQALGWAIANSLWQMALLWVLYQCSFLLLRKAKASVKTTTATLLLFGGFLWFVVSLVRHYWELDLHPVASDNGGLLFNSYTAAPEATHTLLAYVNRILGMAEHYLPYLSFAYLLVLVFLLMRVFKSYQHVKAVRTEGLTRIDPQWKIYIKELAYRIGIHREVRLWLSEKIDVPATIGYLKPLILIPIASFNQLSTEQVEAILLHELAHIRRHDYLLNLVITVVETILFFNPFAQLISRHIKTERENSCDDFVLQFRYNPHAYASALLSLEKQRLAPELAMAASGKTELLNRIRRILNVPGSTMNYGQKLMAMVITAGILASLAWLTPENVENKPILSSISILLPASAASPAPVDFVRESSQPQHKNNTTCCTGNGHNRCPKMGPQRIEAPAQLLSEDTIKQWEDLTFQNPEMDQISEDLSQAQPKVEFYRDSKMQIDIDSLVRFNLDFQKKVEQLQKLQFSVQFQFRLPNDERAQVVQEQEKKLSEDQEKFQGAKQKAGKPNKIILDFSKLKITQDSASRVVIQILKASDKGGSNSVHVIAINDNKSNTLKSLKLKVKAKVMDQDDDVDPGIQADQPGWQAPEIKQDQPYYTAGVIPTAYRTEAYNSRTGAYNNNTAVYYNASGYITPSYKVASSYKERVVFNKGANTEIHDLLGKLDEMGLLPVGCNVRIVRTNGHITVNGVTFNEELGRQFQSYFQGRNFLIYTSGRVIEAYFR